MKVSLLVTCSGMIALAPQCALAQQQSADTHIAATDSSGIAEIVVTAQHRSENAQKSSLAMDVVTGAALAKAGVSQAADLTRMATGLQLAQVGATAQPYIRGVGNSSNTGLNDSGVAFNVDGIYIGQSVAYGLDFFDVSRIEVLKGPQGTLYGRNATGGAINLITNEPGRNLGGYVTAEYGNYNNKRAAGALNLPLSSDLSARAAFNVVDRDGYYKDGSGDDVQQEGRLRVKWTPGGMKWLFNVEYGHAGGVGGGAAIIDGNLDHNPANGLEYNLVHPWDGMTSPANLAQYNNAEDKTHPQKQDIDALMVSTQLDLELGNDIVLTLLPSYRFVTSRVSSYTTNFFFQTNPSRWNEFTTEARLSHSIGNWKWSLGAYYFDQKTDGSYFVDQQILPIGTFGPADALLGHGINLTVDQFQKVKSYSFFGETTYGLTSALRLIAGLRYTHDDNHGSGTQTFDQSPASTCNAAAPCVQQYAAGVTANNVSWKGGAEYDLGPQSMLFATASTGFKAGGIFPASPPRNTFLPEKLLAFEFGSRNRFFGNRLQVNLEGFYWRYNNKQETIGGYDSCGGPVCPAPLQPGTLTNLTINAGRARIFGGSADVVFKATPTTTLHGALEYANSRYLDFVYQVPTTPNTGCAQSGPNSAGLFTVNCDGMPLTRAPLWNGTADFEQVIPTVAGNLVLGGNLTYTSSRYIDAHFLKNTFAPPYALLGADLTYKVPGDRITITAYIKNIGNKAAPITGYSLADTGVQPFTAAAILQAPRTYGIRLRADF